MPDDTMTSGGTVSDSGTVSSSGMMMSDAETIAKDSAEVAVPTVMASVAAHDDFETTIDKTAAAEETVLAKDLPPIEHEAWDFLKGWVRREIMLARAGHSEETRVVQNP